MAEGNFDELRIKVVTGRGSEPRLILPDIMDPGRAVEEIIQDLALQGDVGSSLDEFWIAVQTIIDQPLDEVFKGAIWRWVSRDRRVAVTDRHGSPIQIDDILEHGSLKLQDDIMLRTEEEYQWLAITGQPKADSPIGALAYKLLCAVCRSRSSGMSAIELNRATGQDPRSIHGRIAQLADLGLVVRYPVVQNKAHTHLIVYKKYVKEYLTTGTEAARHIDKFQLLKSIISWCKSGPGGMRLRQDLFLQLEFDKLPRGGPIFNNLLHTGEREGYIVSLNVYESERPESLYRCVKFLKELDNSNAVTQDDINENDDEDDDEEEITLDSHVQDRNLDITKLVVAGEAGNSRNVPLVNLIYPIEHQVYDLVRSAGSTGLPAMDLYRRLTGFFYRKPLSRLLDILLAADPKKKPTPACYKYLGFVRGIDFVARMKFYRYFTQVTFAHFEKRPADPEWGVMPSPSSSKVQALSLQNLDAQESAPLAGASSVMETPDGRLVSLFHGDKPIPGSLMVVSAAKAPPPPGKRRGRPPKNAPKVAPEPSKPSLQPEVANDYSVADRTWRGGSPTSVESRTTAAVLRPPTSEPESPQQSTSQAKPENSKPTSDPSPVTPKTPSLSLAAAKREADILAIMNEGGGMCIGGISLLKQLEGRGDSTSTIDRKTMERTISRMVASGTIKQVSLTLPQRGIFITRYIIHDPAIPADDSKLRELKESLSTAIQTVPTPAAPARLSTMVEGDIAALSTGTSSPRRYRVLASAVKPKGERRRFGPSAAEISQAAAAAELSGTSELLSPSRSSRVRAAKKERTKRSTVETQTPRKRRKEDEEGTDTGTPIDAERLYRSIVISRSLYPRGSSIDWDLVVKGMPGIGPSRARKRWPAIREQYGGTKALAKATERWEQLFLSAYSKSQIDYHDCDADDFTLQVYVEFWQHHVDASLFGGVKRLTTRADFEERYGKIRAHPIANPLEGVYNLPSMVRVEELMANTAFSCSPAPGIATVKNVDFTLDEQLVRAVIASEESEMSPETAAQLLSELGEERVSTATEALAAGKVIHYILRSTEKVQPGRNYTLGERPLATLNTKLDPGFLKTARNFLRSMPDSYAIPSTVEDAEMAVILELASSNDCRLLRLNNNTGRLITDYRSRMIEKQKLDFDISLEISSSFRRPPLLYDKPPVADSPNHYLWQFSDTAFELVVSRILLLIVLRPHITLALIAAQLRSALSTQEVLSIVQWLRETGRVEEEQEGLIASRFWFC